MKLAEAYKQLLGIDLNEGLIKTVPIEKAAQILSRWLESHEFKFRMESFPESNSAGLVRISLVFKAPYIPKSQYVSGNNPASPIKGLMQTINNLGWFVATYETSNKRGKFDLSSFLKDMDDYDGAIRFNIEQKYDYELSRSKVGDKLYHITSPAAVDKILKIGLTPKTRSKMATHPDRIYLSNSISDLTAIADQMDSFLRGNGTVILQIDTNKIPSKAKFYRDPDFSNDPRDDGGFYTYTNIPPNAISVYKQLSVDDYT